MDDTTIANLACSAIGTRSRIQSLAENSAEAYEVSLWYATVRDDLLRAHEWGFARYQATLAVLKAAAGTPENPAGTGLLPPRPWRYAYAWPDRCLDARYICPAVLDGGTLPGLPLTTGGIVAAPVLKKAINVIPFEVAVDVDPSGNDRKVILCDLPAAELVHTRLVTDPNLWDANFRTAMIGKLGEKLCMPLKGDKKMLTIAMQAAAAALKNAEAGDGSEGIVLTDRVPDWIAARDGEGADVDGGLE